MQRATNLLRRTKNQPISKSKKHRNALFPIAYLKQGEPTRFLAEVSTDPAWSSAKEKFIRKKLVEAGGQCKEPVLTLSFRLPDSERKAGSTEAG